MRRSALLLFFIAAPWAAFAAPSDELVKTQDAIKVSKAQQEKLAKEQAAVESDLEDLQEKLVKSASALQRSDAQLHEAEARLATLTRELETKERAYEQKRKKIDGLSRIAIRLSRTPPQAMVLMPEDGKDRIQAARALALITAEIKTQSQLVAKEVEALSALKGKVENDKEKAEKIKEANRLEKKSFEAALKKRKALRDKIAASRTQEEAKIASLAKKASSLQDLVSRLEKESRKSRPVKGEREVVSDEGVEGSSGKLRSFKDARGRIRIPVSGRVVEGFAAGDGSKGIKIATADGATVVAPFDAEVAYSGTFLNYGKLVILKHRGDYHTLLAGLGRIDVKAGDFLLEGEPIGAMGEDNKRLYVELRENNQPVNPNSWMRGL